jgi:hypothetical protein
LLSPSPSGPPYSDDAKVVLVTGTTGSLVSHLVYSLAQLPDVKTVVCLNHENRDEPVARQAKAIREKGIRFPETLKSKLLVLQADTSKPRLGLDQQRYEDLTVSVTHLIHNAWPMSAKRALSGFEPQFQVFRNLIQFSSHVKAKRWLPPRSLIRQSQDCCSETLFVISLRLIDKRNSCIAPETSRRLASLRVEHRRNRTKGSAVGDYQKANSMSLMRLRSIAVQDKVNRSQIIVSILGRELSQTHGREQFQLKCLPPKLPPSNLSSRVGLRS